jgi:hypothetical protein
MAGNTATGIHSVFDFRLLDCGGCEQFIRFPHRVHTFSLDRQIGYSYIHCRRFGIQMSFQGIMNALE